MDIQSTTISPVVIALATLACTLALVAALAAILPWLRTKRQGYPLEEQLEQALLPYAFSAICAAYRLSEWAMDETGRRMHGIDKRKLAAELYARLPDRIGKFDITDVKRLITPDRFAAIVQTAFDQFDGVFLHAQGHYQSLFQAWIDEWNALGQGRSGAGAPTSPKE